MSLENFFYEKNNRPTMKHLAIFHIANQVIDEEIRASVVPYMEGL